MVFVMNNVPERHLKTQSLVYSGLSDAAQTCSSMPGRRCQIATKPTLRFIPTVGSKGNYMYFNATLKSKVWGLSLRMKHEHRTAQPAMREETCTFSP